MSTIKADAITASTGTNTNIGITGKGSGKVKLGDGNLLFPDADGSAGQYIKTDGSANLAFATLPAASQDMVLLSTTNASTASTVDLTGNFSTTYTSYIVKGVDIFSSSSSASLNMQVIYNSAAITGGVYYGHRMIPSQGSASYAGSVMSAANEFKIINALSSGTHQGTGFVVETLNAPATTNSYKYFIWRGMSAEGWTINYGAGGVNDASNSNLTGIRFLTSAGTVSGKFLVYGIK